MIATLLGAWATHSVSREELDKAITGVNERQALQLTNITTRLDIFRVNNEKMLSKMEDLQSTVDRALGHINVKPSVVYRYPVYTPGEKGTPGATR